MQRVDKFSLYVRLCEYIYIYMGLLGCNVSFQVTKIGTELLC